MPCVSQLRVTYSDARRALAALWLAAMPLSYATAQVPVPVVTLQGKSVATGFELEGIIQPVRQSTVAAQTAGRVIRLAVKMGDRVKAGQLLATIDDRELAADVQRSRAQITQSEAELRNAQLNLERTRELQSKGFVSKAALDSAETQFKAAKAGRDQAGAAATQASLAQGHTRVTAPYEGWVLQTHVEAGDLALPGKPMVTVYAPQPLRAVVQVPASRAIATSQSSQVQILVGGEWVSPSARSTMPSADPVSQTIEWRLDLAPKVSQALLPGEQVRVRFVGGQAERMVVPATALLRRGELTAVYVVQGQGFVLRAVRLGADHGAQGVEIMAGINAGDSVALDPVRAGLAGAQPVAQPATGAK